MKICTACNASYSDETLSFCPVDGTTLTPQKEISFDQVPFSYEPGTWSDTANAASDPADSFTNPKPPPSSAAFTAPPSSAPQNYSPAPRRKTNSDSIFPVVVGAIALAVFTGVLMAMISGGSKSSEPLVHGNTSGETFTLDNGARVRAVPVDSSRVTSRSGNTAFVTNAPAAADAAPASNSATLNNIPLKPLSRKTDFTGIWTGEFGDEPAVLSITTQNADTFSGTLSKKGYIIKVSGKVDFEKGTVNIKETKVLQTPPNLNWYLGTNDGAVSENGKSISGTGSDKTGYYEWSFKKD